MGRDRGTLARVRRARLGPGPVRDGPNASEQLFDERPIAVIGLKVLKRYGGMCGFWVSWAYAAMFRQPRVVISENHATQFAVPQKVKSI